MTGKPTTEIVWSTLSEDLRRFIRRRVADEHVADDLLQETFVRIHQHIGTLDQADRLTAWVYRIARNAIHDHFRRRRPAAVDVADAEPVAEQSGRWEQFSGRAHVWIEELIQQLPERYREAVRLSEIEQLTQQEVADRLGLSLSGAKSRIQRGRSKLKDVLVQCCAIEFDRRGNLSGCDPRPDRAVCRNCEDLDVGLP